MRARAVGRCQTKSQEDAEETIALMSEVLDEVYQSPARLASAARPGPAAGRAASRCS